MLPLPGLSSASGKSVVVKVDGGFLSSDGGVLALRAIETRLRVADRLAARPCIMPARSARSALMIAGVASAPIRGPGMRRGLHLCFAPEA
ncbi:hypothetical protein DFR50_102167 [Roseiarcus fermentans]|uniref:DDE family transposase n=1 Tax=Roseiarcus fermentans TaxID=1473586 RepID=A0A366FVA4_9HYPH|nr:hypothetical protein DFR50_102167 [Roseiarcus fermentans]